MENALGEIKTEIIPGSIGPIPMRRGEGYGAFSHAMCEVIGVQPDIPKTISGTVPALRKVEVALNAPIVKNALKRFGIRVDGNRLTREGRAKEISFPVAQEIQSYFAKQGLVVGEVEAQKRMIFMPTHQGGSTKNKLISFDGGVLCYVSANGRENKNEAKGILDQIKEKFLELEALGSKPSNMEIAISEVTNLSVSSRRQVLVAEVMDAQRTPQGILVPVFEKMNAFIKKNGDSFSSNERITMIKL